MALPTRAYRMVLPDGTAWPCGEPCDLLLSSREEKGDDLRSATNIRQVWPHVEAYCGTYSMALTHGPASWWWTVGVGECDMGELAGV